jgi:hypothetical protein
MDVIRTARRAGIQQASAAAARVTPRTAAYIVPSLGLTPYGKPERDLPERKGSGQPCNKPEPGTIPDSREETLQRKDSKGP